MAQPNWEYTAPECILAQTHTTASDIFSLGMLIYALHSPGNETLFPARDLQQTKRRAHQLAMPRVSESLRCLPEPLREHIALMLSVAEERRPVAHQLIKVIVFRYMIYI